MSNITNIQASFSFRPLKRLTNTSTKAMIPRKAKMVQKINPYEGVKSSILKFASKIS